MEKKRPQSRTRRDLVFIRVRVHFSTGEESVSVFCKLNTPLLSDWAALVSVLLAGRRHHPGGHLGGVAHRRGEAAAGGEVDPQEDIRLLLPHHQGSGGQHGPAGRTAEEGGRAQRAGGGVCR